MIRNRWKEVASSLIGALSGVLIVAGILSWAEGWARGGKKHSQDPQSSSGSSVSSSGGGSEGNGLLKKLSSVQSEELKALEREYQGDLKRLKASQKTQLSMWEASEKEARHLYFKEHQSGPERRAYIQDFLKRREQFNHDLSSEKELLKKSFEQKVLEFKTTHLKDSVSN